MGKEAVCRARGAVFRLRWPGEQGGGAATFDEEALAGTDLSCVRGRDRAIVVDSGGGRTGLLKGPS